MSVIYQWTVMDNEQWFIKMKLQCKLRKGRLYLIPLLLPEYLQKLRWSLCNWQTYLPNLHAASTDDISPKIFKSCQTQLVMASVWIWRNNEQQQRN